MPLGDDTYYLFELPRTRNPRIYDPSRHRGPVTHKTIKQYRQRRKKDQSTPAPRFNYITKQELVGLKEKGKMTVTTIK